MSDGRAASAHDAADVAVVPGGQAAVASDELVALYDAVGWGAYTVDADRLAGAVAGSAYVATARTQRERQLVGLARCLTDGHTVAYLQDVLVHPSRQRDGLGSRLVGGCLAACGELRQQVLLTDADPAQLRFYAALGFTATQDHDPPLTAFVRFA